MKTQSVKLLDLIIRESLRTNSVKSIDEQVIPTKEEWKYSWNNNMTSESEQKNFRTYVRVNHTTKMAEIGLLSQDKVDKLDAAGKKKQLALLKQVWKTYGKEYLEYLGVDDVNVETNSPFYLKPWFIISASLAIAAIGLFAKYKLLTKLFGAFGERAAKKYRTQIALGRTDLSPKQVDEFVDMILNLKRGARQEYLESILRRQMAPEQAAACAEAIEKSPAIQNQIQVTLVGEAAENFINGKGMTEAGLKKVMGPKNWKEKGPALKRARAKVTGETPKKPATPKVKPAAITLKTMGKLKGSVGTTWTNLINSAATDAEIRTAVRRRVGGENNYSLKTVINAENTVKNKLSKKIGNKSTGAWILNKHLKAATFPEYITWVTDLKAAGITRKLDETDYLISKALWNLAK